MLNAQCSMLNAQDPRPKTQGPRPKVRCIRNSEEYNPRMRTLRIVAMLSCPLSVALAEWHWIDKWLILPAFACGISSAVVAIRNRANSGIDDAPSLNLNR